VYRDSLSGRPKVLASGRGVFGTATLSESRTEMTEILLPNQTNSLGRALGGTVLHWMDIRAAVASMRFAGKQCVTASMDHVDSVSPIDLGEVAVIQGYVFETGTTSIEARVDVHAEDPIKGEKRLATTSFSPSLPSMRTGDQLRCRRLIRISVVFYRRGSESNEVRRVDRR